MLRMRIISSVIFFVLLFLGLFQPMLSWVLLLVMTGAALTGVYEYIHLGAERPARIYQALALAGTVALMVDAYFWYLQHAIGILSAVTVLTMGAGLMIADRRIQDSCGKCISALLYVVLPLTLITLIWRKAVLADNDNGQHYLIFLVLVTQASDIGAYFIGRAFGRHKLAPVISPGKSVEGLFGGVFASTLLAVLMKLFWNNMDHIFGWGEVFALALMLSLIGPVGDLAESWLKRNSGMKDSGRTFTGHGGMLDIIDSLLFTTIFYYAYLWLFHHNIV